MRLARALAAAVLALAAAGLAHAQFPGKYPSRPVTLVVPYPPGGSNDTLARGIATGLSRAWKVPVRVDNRPGEGGTTGAAFVSRAEPDGYTLCLLSSSFTTNAAIQPALPYDPVGGFTPVAMVASGPLLLTVSNSLPVRTTLELFDLARRHPGELTFGSSGIGSINHFAAELLMDAAQIRLVHMPYKGIAGAVTHTIEGKVNILIASAPSIYQQVKAGKVRALGVTTAKPSALLPGLRPLAEMGVPGYHVELWWGILAPPRMAPELVQAINGEVNRVIATPAVAEMIEQEGAEPLAATPERFAAVIRGQIGMWRKVALQADIRPE